MEEEEDDFGPVAVPDRNSFFMVLTATELIALDSRYNAMTRAVASIAISNIKPVSKGKKGFTGGLVDIGNFKEGFCFEIV